MCYKQSMGTRNNDIPADRRCAICEVGESTRWHHPPKNRSYLDAVAVSDWVCHRCHHREYSKWYFHHKSLTDPGWIADKNAKRNVYEQTKYQNVPEYAEKIRSRLRKGGAGYAGKLARARNAIPTDQQRVAAQSRRSKYAAKNPDRIAQSRMRIHRSLRFQHRSQMRVAKDRKIPHHLTLDEFSQIRRAGRCHYCGNVLAETGPQQDRVNSDLPYLFDNLVPCCRDCNTVKGKWLTESEMVQFCKVRLDVHQVEAISKSPWNVPPTIKSFKRRYTYLETHCRRKGHLLNLSFKEYCLLVDKQPCTYCGGSLGNGFALDRVDPKIKEYSTASCVPCCFPCNQIKNDVLNSDEMRLLVWVVCSLRETN